MLLKWIVSLQLIFVFLILFTQTNVALGGDGRIIVVPQSFPQPLSLEVPRQTSLNENVYHESSDTEHNILVDYYNTLIRGWSTITESKWHSAESSDYSANVTSSVVTAQVYVTLATTVLTLSILFLTTIRLRADRKNATAGIQSAEAMILQSRALVCGQRPVLGFAESGIEFYHLDREKIIPGLLPRMIVPTLILCNFGAAPAVLLEFCINWRVTFQDSRAPCELHGARVSANKVLPPKEVSRHMLADAKVDLDEKTTTAILNNTSTLWIYGYVRYRDETGDVYDWGFIASWEEHTSGVVPPRGVVIGGPSDHSFLRKLSSQIP